MKNIEFFYETDFEVPSPKDYTDWVINCADEYSLDFLTISYIFCTDAYLLEINKKFLKHDSLTDIITFEYSGSPNLNADIYISVDRIRENAKEHKVEFEDELRRVMSHGLLHLAGFKDKKKEDKSVMRVEEEKCMKMFHVKH